MRFLIAWGACVTSATVEGKLGVYIITTRDLFRLLAYMRYRITWWMKMNIFPFYRQRTASNDNKNQESVTSTYTHTVLLKSIEWIKRNKILLFLFCYPFAISVRMNTLDKISKYKYRQLANRIYTKQKRHISVAGADKLVNKFYVLWQCYIIKCLPHKHECSHR